MTLYQGEYVEISERASARYFAVAMLVSQAYLMVRRARASISSLETEAGCSTLFGFGTPESTLSAEEKCLLFRHLV